MKSWRLWWLPSLLVLAPAFDLVPSHRDLLDYFAPMRYETAQRLVSGELPWLNWSNGCGEPWFANPQTGVLYPVHWIYAALPQDWAISIEIAIHLMLLAFGAGALVRSLGGTSSGRQIVEVAAWSLPPVFMCAGVLNNLETLAWAPLLFVLALERERHIVPGVALVTALAWLAGEPTLWAMMIGGALLVASQRTRVATGIGVGLALVSIQIVPFLFWVSTGDRGPSLVTEAARGALAYSQLWGLLLPGATRLISESSGYVETLFLGAPFITLALLGLRRRWYAAAAIFVFFCMALLPLVGGERLYLTLTFGLVRYPSRFAIYGVLCVLPFIGLGFERWKRGEGCVLAAVLALVTLAGCVILPSPWHWVSAGLPASVLLAACLLQRFEWLRLAAVGVGIAGGLVASWPFLDLQPADNATVRPLAWQENHGTARLYVPAPSSVTVGWLMVSQEARWLWPTGYLNLYLRQPQSATYAPIAESRLADHLREADHGPEARWWLDALGARWMVTSVAPKLDGIIPLRETHGVWLSENTRALPLVTLADAPPKAQQPWRGIGALVCWAQYSEGIEATSLSETGGFLWVSVTPDPGWEWRLNDQSIDLESGPGILQYVAVDSGVNRLVGRYRPPGLGWSVWVSLGGLIALCFLTVTRSKRG
ncbi:MAG: hypothetical protein GY906_00530 [bacterium]|nr:hypothetical protein [bacterium]